MPIKPAANARKKPQEPRLKIKRIYAPAEADDGFRVLVDRLWPRGISKEKARIDLWLKDVSPSDGLRRLVHGDPAKWTNFVSAYKKELAVEPARSAVKILREKIAEGPLTLLYAARDEERNNAVALKAYLGL